MSRTHFLTTFLHLQKMSLKREASTRSARAPSLDDDESSTSSIYTTCDPLSDPEAGDVRRSRREQMASSRELSSSSLSQSQRSLRTMTRIHQLVDSPTREASVPSRHLWTVNRAASDYEDHNIYLNDVSDDASESSIRDYFITAAEAGRSKAVDYDDTETDETDHTEFTRQTGFEGCSKTSFQLTSDRPTRAHYFPRLLCGCLLVVFIMVVCVGITLFVGQSYFPLKQLFTDADAGGVLHSPNETTISDPVTTLPELNGTSSHPSLPQPHRPDPSSYFGDAENATRTVEPTLAPSSTGPSSSNSSSIPDSDTSASQFPETTPSSACYDLDESYWFQMIDGTTTLRNCEWLRNQSDVVRTAWCGDGPSYAFITCHLTCGAC